MTSYTLYERNGHDCREHGPCEACTVWFCAVHDAPTVPPKSAVLLDAEQHAVLKQQAIKGVISEDRSERVFAPLKDRRIVCEHDWTVVEPCPECGTDCLCFDCYINPGCCDTHDTAPVQHDGLDGMLAHLDALRAPMSMLTAILEGRENDEIVEVEASLLYSVRAALSTALLDDVECPECGEGIRHRWPCSHVERCDEPGCDKESDCGWPTKNGEPTFSGDPDFTGYRRTCGNHARYITAAKESE
jgi:hypothetical protein